MKSSIGISFVKSFPAFFCENIKTSNPLKIREGASSHVKYRRGGIMLLLLILILPLKEISAQQQIINTNEAVFQEYIFSPGAIIGQTPATHWHQWDVATQPSQVAMCQNPSYVSTNGLGQFVVGSNGLQLVGNDGGVIGQTNSIYSDANIAIATNHFNGYAIATTTVQNGIPAIQVRISHILPSTAADHNYGNHNYVSTRNPNIILSNIPSVCQTMLIVGGSGTSINRVEVAMDLEYTYIAWQTNTRRLGYAIIKNQNESIAVAPANVLDPLNNPVLGSIPTIACNRWDGTNSIPRNDNTTPNPLGIGGPIVYHNDQSRSPIHIAFAQDGGAGRPLDFVITPLTWATVTNVLVRPPNVADWEWVRVCYDAELNNISGCRAWYFYGVICAGQGGMAVNFLYSTDGVTPITATPANPDAVNPVTATLVFDPNLNNPIPPMALCDEYQSISVPGDATNRLLYCVYKDKQVNNQTIKICTQAGRSNQQVIFQAPANVNLAFYTLGSNQMGTFSLFDAAGPTAIWRNFQPLWTEFQVENTVASGLVDVEDMEESADGTGGRAMFLEQGDTLRIFGDRTNGQNFRFKDDNVLITSWGIDFDQPVFTVGGNPLYHEHGIWDPIPSAQQFPMDEVLSRKYRRGLIIFDNSAQVDFNNLQFSGFCPGSLGGIKYDGAEFVNMNTDFFGGSGLDNYPNSDVNFNNSNIDFFYSILDINAPLTIDNGSVFYGHKAKINFLQATAQVQMATLSIKGSGSSISCDTCDIYMGSTSKTINDLVTDGLRQIVMNPDNTNSLNQTFSIINSNVKTNNPNQHDDFGNNSNLSRSDILIKKPLKVDFNHSDIEQVYTEVRDPVANVNYNDNWWILGAQDILNINWNPTQHALGARYAGQISVSNNIVVENFPIGTSTNPMHDFVIDHFQILPSDLARIQVKHNTINQWPVFDPNFLPNDLIGIVFDRGTNGAINFNSIRNHHTIGIHTNAELDSRPFVCSNNVGVFGCACNNIGIKQDGRSFVTGGYTKINDLENCTIGYFATGSDQSNLVGNFFTTNGTGALFANNARTILNGNHGGNDNYAGFNQIFSNTSINIELQAQGGAPLPFLGFTSFDQTWGQNIFTLPNGSNAKQMNFTSGGVYTLPVVNEVSQNQWAPAISIGNNTTDAANCPNLTYTNTVNVNALLANFTCGGGFTGAHGKSVQPLAADPNDCYYYSVHWPDSVCLYEKALTYDGIDPYMCRDSMRRYVELHPYATVSPGQTLNAFRHTFASSADIWYTLPNGDNSPWINEYNWLVKMQPINPDREYQQYVISGLANSLGYIDENEEANMWYNYTLLFPDDSEGIAECWYTIRGIRKTQSRIPEDTTPFHKLTFPLQPLQEAVVTLHNENTHIQMSLVPNPAKLSTTAEISTSNPGIFILQMYDALGRKIKDIFSGYIDAGKRNINVDVSNVSEGQYYLRLQNSGGIVTQKLVINR